MLGRGSAPDAYTEKVHAWVAGVAVRPEPPILAKARSAIQRILGPESELRDLWEESEHAAAWRAGVEELRDRLSLI
jgi:hypothetical protein